jgi:hypothetical protein
MRQSEAMMTMGLGGFMEVDFLTSRGVDEA